MSTAIQGDVNRICEKIHHRLRTLHHQLEQLVTVTASSAESKGSRGSISDSITSNSMVGQDERAITQLTALTQQYERFLQEDARKHLVFRVADTRRLQVLFQMQEELDSLYRIFRLRELDPVAQWRIEWNRDREDVDAYFQSAFATTETLYNELRTPEYQSEALGVLRYAIERLESQFGSSAELEESNAIRMTLLKSAMRKILTFATVGVPSIPQWFISRADLSIDTNPLRGNDTIEIFQGRWGRFSTPVWIKRLVHPETNSRQLAEELELWNTLDHPHILKMYGGCLIGSYPYMVLESPSLQSLDEYLMKSRENPNSIVCGVLLEAAKGLLYLHEECMVQHHDLQLGHIYITLDGTVKLGNITSFWTRSDSSQAVSRTNTSRWTAPELLPSSSCSSSVDGFAVDVYSFGMCILEAMTGEVPWGLFMDEETIRIKVLSGALPPRTQVDDQAWDLIVSMCAFDPLTRPNMRHVVESLQLLAEKEAAQSIIAQRSIVSSRLESRASSLVSDTLLSSSSSIEVPIGYPISELVECQEIATTIVTIHQSWLGIKINSIGSKVVVSKFLRSSNGAIGEIEASGVIHLGDILLAVNDHRVGGMSRKNVGALIQSTPRPIQLEFGREKDLILPSWQFIGLQSHPHISRDRGLVVPLPHSVERLLGTEADEIGFSINVWFSVKDEKNTVFGGILIGAQDVEFTSSIEPRIHQQLVMIDPQGHLSCHILQNQPPVLIASDLIPNQWYQLSITYHYRRLSVYLNTMLRHSGQGSLLTDWSRLTHIQVGSGCMNTSIVPVQAKPNPTFTGWYGFTGLVYDVEIWHRALQEIEIQQLFRGGGDCVEMPVYSMRRDVPQTYTAPFVPRRVGTTRPQHVVAQVYC